MIDESFIKAAIKIRREYLKLTNNLNFYKRKAEDVIENLEDIVTKIENILKNNSIISKNHGFSIMPKTRSLDINDIDDLNKFKKII